MAAVYFDVLEFTCSLTKGQRARVSVWTGQHGRQRTSVGEPRRLDDVHSCGNAISLASYYGGKHGHQCEELARIVRGVALAGEATFGVLVLPLRRAREAKQPASGGTERCSLLPA